MEEEIVTLGGENRLCTKAKLIQIRSYWKEMRMKTIINVKNYDKLGNESLLHD